MNSNEFIEYVGNESQMGSLELTYSALVIIPVRKLQQIYDRVAITSSQKYRVCDFHLYDEIAIPSLQKYCVWDL